MARRRLPGLLAGLLTLPTLLAGCAGPPAPTLTPSAATSPARPTPPPRSFPPLVLDGTNAVRVDATWAAWTLLDRRTGQVWGSANDTELNRTASMTKAWLAALYLRQNPDPSQEWLDRLSVMIRDSDNLAADRVHRALGGDDAVTAAMGSVCGVDGVRLVANAHPSTADRGWAWVGIAPRQEAQLGACIASGRVAGDRWTAWVLDEMRRVEGAGDFGIRQAFTGDDRSDIAIKNGWIDGGGGWIVNCLAIGTTWVLAVESRSATFANGREVCRSVTEQLLA